MKTAARNTLRLLAAVYLALLSALLLPRLFGLQVNVVTSGSMEPAIPAGAVILVQPAAFEDIQEGDIITFYLEQSRTKVTHRVVKKEEKNQRFLTKGDANEAPDARPAAFRDTEGIVRWTIPGLGQAAVFVSTRKGKITLFSLLALLMTLDGLLSRIIERN